MAHFAKFQASALGNMCAHYERKPELERGYRRANIDPERTAQNYNLAPERACGQVAFVQERIGALDLKRTPRKDAVRMVDCVLTLPRSFDQSRAGEFFAAAFGLMSERFGSENVVSAYVHMDESQPHMHFAFVPVTEDGRLSAKDVLNRNMLQRFHGELQEGMERALGCPCEVLLDDETRGDRAAKYVDMDEFRAATDRLERLRREERGLEREIERLEPASESVGESARALLAARNLRGREEVLGSEIESLRERVRAAESEKTSIEGEIRGLERDIPGLERSVRSARERFEKLARDVRGYVANVGERVARLLSRFGVEAYAGQPPMEVQMRQAQEAAKAVNAGRGYVPRDRGVSR